MEFQLWVLALDLNGHALVVPGQGLHPADDLKVGKISSVVYEIIRIAPLLDTQLFDRDPGCFFTGIQTKRAHLGGIIHSEGIGPLARLNQELRHVAFTEITCFVGPVDLEDGPGIGLQFQLQQATVQDQKVISGHQEENAEERGPPLSDCYGSVRLVIIVVETSQKGWAGWLLAKRAKQVHNAGVSEFLDVGKISASWGNKKMRQIDSILSRQLLACAAIA